MEVSCEISSPRSNLFSISITSRSMLSMSDFTLHAASNAMIANILEYGKPGQPPTGFLKKAKNKSRKLAEAKMVEVLEKEMNSV